MKRLLIPLLLLAVTTADAQAPRWQVVESAPIAGGRHDDIKFIDDDHGWLVNTGGELWQTEDGGETWNLKWSDPDRSFRSVAFTGDGRGWIGTVFNPQWPLLETLNGGRTWNSVNAKLRGPKPAGICGLSMVDDQHVYGVGAFHGEPHFVRTTDGGDSWTSIDMSPYAATLIDVHFLTPSLGFATGGTGSDLNGDAVVLKTTTGGLFWQVVHRTTRNPGIDGEWGWKISFPTDEVGYVSVETISNREGYPAKILKTTDGGNTWTAMPIVGSVERAGLQAVGFLTENVGWASGRGTSSVTMDGGATWQQLSPLAIPGQGEMDGRVNRFFFLNDSTAYATGKYVYRMDLGQTSTAREAVLVPETFTISPPYPNPFRDNTTLPLRLDEAEFVRVSIIDVGGRHQRWLQAGLLPPGQHEIRWDGRTDTGQPVASGRYIVLLDVGSAWEMKQLVRVR